MKFCCSAGAGDFLLYPHRRQNLVVDLDGMAVPTYKIVPRACCRLLRLAWDRRWRELCERCEKCPEEAFYKTEHSGRTALHLATFNEGCPLEVAVTMLKANRHAILVEDKNCYTPLHNLGLFHGGDELMSLFCDTAIMVEQELKGRGKIPTLSRTSPLYLAAKRDAPASTIRLLLQTRSRSQWIAPFTGGEPYWDPQQTLDNFSSPLEILLRGRASCFIGISNETKQQMKMMALASLDGSASPESMANERYVITARDSHDQSAITMWEKCLLLLRENILTAHNEASAADATKVPSLFHTVASLKVPMPVLLKLCMEIFPEQVTQRDETGNYALYHVVKSNHPYATKQIISIVLQSAKNEGRPKNGRFSVEYINECLLQALETRLPWEEGLEQIIMANSDVLRKPDASTKLVPALTAAAQDAAVEIIFHLLQAEPHVLSSFCDDR